MNYEHKQIPPIVGLIDHLDFEALNAREDDDSRLLALRERLGEVAENAVAILYSEDLEVKAKYVVVGRDRGTTIPKFESHGLPEPLETAREIQSRSAIEQVEHGEESSSEFERFNTGLIEQLEATKPAIDFVDTAVESSRSIATAFDQSVDLWNQMKNYNQISEAGVSDLVNQLYMVRQRIMDEQEPTMTMGAHLNAILAELEGMQRDPALESPEDTHARDDSFYALRKFEEGLSETVAQLRATNNLREEIVDRTTQTIMQLDQMLQDSWGREAYEAQVSGYLNALVSDPYLQTYGPLSRAQAALEDVIKIKAKLINKEL